jgi:MFS family permease
LYATLRAFDEGVLFYPLYALLFAAAGLSTAQITSLFVIWTGVAFVFEVPSGAWADAFSRRRLLATGAVIRAAGFLAWGIFPNYYGFAFGFVCWALYSALSSGTMQALLYDELAALGATDRYTPIIARAATAAMVAMLVATALATPAYAWGGFRLITAGSVLVGLGSAVTALLMPERPRFSSASSGGLGAYLHSLRTGLSEVRHEPRIWRAVLVAALVPGLTALDEYVGLLVNDLGVAVVGVPLALTAMVGAMAAGSLYAERKAAATPVWIACAVGISGIALTMGSLSGTLFGLIPIAVCYGLLQMASVLTEARLQDAMSGQARATVLSVSGLGMEIAALLVYAAFAAGSARFDVPQLSALFGLPIVAIGVLTARWLPRHLHSTDSTDPTDPTDPP